MPIIDDLINYLKDMSTDKIVTILIAIICITLFCIFSSLVSYVIIKMFNRKEKNKEKIKANPFYIPIKVTLILIGLYVAISMLKLPETAVTVWRKIFKIAMILVLSKALANVVDPKSELMKRIVKMEDEKKDETFTNFIGRILKYVIYIFAAFLIITELGYDISGLVAGLGIGGAVVALAAQDMVKSLIAGMSILADKPFLVGDWIEVGADQGTVLDISFRCTKIQTNTNTVITLPNSVLTTTAVINWSRMKQRRYEVNIKLPLETNSDVVETITNRIRFILQSNEKIVPNTVEVHFNMIDQTGINILIYLYTEIIPLNEFLAFKQELNNQILNVLESENEK